MGHLLYIQASPRVGRSHSIVVADAFIDAYRQSQPGDLVRTINIFKARIPAFDGPALQAKYDILHGRSRDPATVKAWGRIESVIGQFKWADKYVFAVPMWNFGIPYRLKQYLDVIIQPGYTFTVTDNGYQGLVTGRPAVVIYARGGRYQAGSAAEAYDLQSRYLELALRFIGFSQIHSIFVEPTLASGPEAAKAAQEQAIAEARQLAVGF
ncbi:MAG: NAD(P)H-dependent oxidoreductase [Sedimentisphaerales bacterium]|nr:NAD(P)H-dependent oxidoreductase [Sedimentisphaerales bacterium]